MKTPRKNAIQKTTTLLNLCRDTIYLDDFNPKRISRMLKTSNTSFYFAVTMGLFEKVSRGKYIATKAEYTDEDSRNLLAFMVQHNIKSKAERRKKTLLKLERNISIVDTKVRNENEELYNSLNQNSENTITLEMAIQIVKSAGHKVLLKSVTWTEI